ncbi:META domain-containing protein [Marivita sp. S0852]|uniref:META domain-containing protein n=1 Tax=Marivita sp. S0852 TaxID=3373893 RepID=UPI003982BC34
MRLITRNLSGLGLAMMMATSAQADMTQTVPFQCDDGRILTVSFADGRAEITMFVSLEAQPSGSGFLYEGDAGVLRGQADEITWQDSASGALACNAVPGGAALVGGTWELIRMDDKEADMPERHTVTFLADGTAHLRADCNNGRGAWQATPASETDGALALGPFAVTRAACANDPFPAMAADLSDVTGYKIDNGGLHLDAASGAKYVFRANTR